MPPTIQQKVGFVNAVLLRATNYEMPHLPGMATSAEKSSTKIRKAFALRLKAVRLSAGFDTAEAIARKLGMRQAETYRRWERGETEPDIAALCRISELTGASLDFLLAGKMGERSAFPGAPGEEHAPSPFKKPRLSNSR